jgi:hypothetical protein
VEWYIAVVFSISPIALHEVDAVSCEIQSVILLAGKKLGKPTNAVDEKDLLRGTAHHAPSTVDRNIVLLHDQSERFCV